MPTPEAEALCQRLTEATSPESAQALTLTGYAGIGVPIVLDTVILGAVGLFRASDQTAYTVADHQLLEIAEQQIDSAIVQTRQLWMLQQRDRELEAIYRLDQLRDENADEDELVNGFMQAIVEQLQAAVAMMILSHPDTGDLTVRGLVDKIGLSADELAMIQKQVPRLLDPGHLQSPRDGLEVLASPFIVGAMRLGAILVARNTPFATDDHRLLFAMTSQMDSAIVYSRVIQQLAQRNKELEIIYHIDQIRDSDIDFDAMLQAVLGEMCRAIQADMGYILLYSQAKEDQLEIKSASDVGVLPTPTYYEVIHHISRRALRQGEMVYDNMREGDVRSIVAVPIVLHDRVIGVFGGVNSKNPIGFNAEDRRILNAIVSQVDTAVFERMEQRRVRQVLGRSVDPKVLAHLLKNTDASNVLHNERMVISVIFADLRGSTEWAERTDPERLTHALNAYLGRMTEVIFEYGGTLDKFVGDEVIGLFGAPLPQADHAERCAQAALRMQKAMAELVEKLKSEGYELPPMGVGVSTGEAICGEFGAAQRTDYTAMGRTMNLGARLCGAAKGGEVVISDQTYQAIKDRATIEVLEGVSLKGIGSANAYKLLKFNG